MFNNFNVNVVRILKKMEEERKEIHHPFVGSEHLLLSLLKYDKNISGMFKKYNITYDIFKSELIKIVGIPKKNINYNLYTPLLKRILNNSISDAKENNNGDVTTRHLILAMLEEGEGVAIRILYGLNIDLDKVYDSFSKKKIKKNQKIDFGKNLNTEVDEKEKTIGREEEIRVVIETLLRRKKSNPLLIGDAGVGKTAIVEELARLINKREVPKELLDTEIISLEMSSLVAGTKYRGEFEDKLNKIIKEALENKNIILFIDEIHTMVSAGGAEGAISAGDIFKPYLARGNIKCIGATTTDEYDKYIAKDKALSRRFEVINIKEPTNEETIDILLKIKDEYEKHHNVKISKNNIKKIVEYSSKYIFNKKNPDKALDFLDSVCTMKHVKCDNSKFINKYLKKLEEVKLKKEKLVSENKYDDAIRYRNKEVALEKMISDKSNSNHSIILEKDILRVLEKKSSVSILNDKEILSKLNNNLDNKIYGQNNQLKELIRYLEYKGKYPDELLSLLFMGPSGVGKSEVVKIITDSIPKLEYIKINGSEYTCESSISKLIGSSPGYVGYSDNFIFSKLKYNPYALILIENFDYLALPIKNLFYQIMEDGFIMDSRSNKISFNNSMIISTITVNQNNKIGFENNNKIKIDSEFKNRFTGVIQFDNITDEIFMKYLKQNNLSDKYMNLINYKKNGFKNIKRELLKINT